MPYGPDDPQPQVWCGCQTRMRLDPLHRPHGFICPDCGGCCNVIPPTEHWEEFRCGAVVRGVRCLNDVPRGGRVCLDCEKLIVRSMEATVGGHRYLLDLLGRRVVADHAETLRRSTEERKADAVAERAAAKEAARADESGHVVYYARLGLNHIKIGTTNRLPQRMAELRVVNPTNLLAAEPGGYAREHERHDQFRKWRYARRKEDFGEGSDLLEHIERVRAEHGDPYELARSLGEESP